MTKISVIIPMYNEEKVISECLTSLIKQTWKDLEIIIVDDGSIDRSLEVVSNFNSDKKNINKFVSCEIKIFKQDHKGPGLVRNMGARQSSGEILVFVDADMTFHPKFIEKLTLPIRNGKTTGTFSKDEYVVNKDNVWSKCWNINKKLPFNKMHPKNYPNKQPVFRAILKKEFLKVGGFEPIGYVDDYTLSEKLGYLATVAENAFFYHRNPDGLGEVFRQARWVGKSEFKRRKIKNEQLMRLIAIFRYNPLFTLINGIYKSIRFKLPQYIVFKFVYDFAIELSLIGSYFDKNKYK